MVILICVTTHFQLENFKSLAEILAICHDFISMMRRKVAFPLPVERKASPNGHVRRDAMHSGCVADHQASGL